MEATIKDLLFPPICNIDHPDIIISSLSGYWGRKWNENPAILSNLQLHSFPIASVGGSHVKISGHGVFYGDDIQLTLMLLLSYS